MRRAPARRERMIGACRIIVVGQTLFPRQRGNRRCASARRVRRRRADRCAPGARAGDDSGRRRRRHRPGRRRRRRGGPSGVGRAVAQSATRASWAATRASRATRFERSPDDLLGLFLAVGAEGAQRVRARLLVRALPLEPRQPPLPLGVRARRPPAVSSRRACSRASSQTRVAASGPPGAVAINAARGPNVETAWSSASSS